MAMVVVVGELRVFIKISNPGRQAGKLLLKGMRQYQNSLHCVQNTAET